MEKVYDFVLEENKQVISIEKISGFLENIILRVDRPCRVRLFLKNHPGVVLYSNVDFKGEELLSLRKLGVDCFGEVFSHGGEKLYLNDELVFEAYGVSGTVGLLKLRWTSG